jgi:hypothetical protein
MGLLESIMRLPSWNCFRRGIVWILSVLLFLSIFGLILTSKRIQSADDRSGSPQLHVPFTSTAPLTDGNLDNPSWGKTTPVELSRLTSDPEFTVEKTTIRLLHDANCLYVQFQAWDTDIRQTVRQHDDLYVHMDDCVELFLAPPVQQIIESVGFEINARGDLLDYRLRADEFINVGWEPRHLRLVSRHYAAGERTDGFVGYVIELAIPWSDLKRLLPDGKAPSRLRGNFSRYDYGKQGRALSIWSDPQSRFHTPTNPAGYGWLIFDPPAP